MTHDVGCMLITAACYFSGSLLGTFLANFLLTRSRMKWENERLRRWLEVQHEQANLRWGGPFRSRVAVPILENAALGVRPDAPVPTSIPGPGRPTES